MAEPVHKIEIPQEVIEYIDIRNKMLIEGVVSILLKNGCDTETIKAVLQSDELYELLKGNGYRWIVNG